MPAPQKPIQQTQVVSNEHKSHLENKKVGFQPYKRKNKTFSNNPVRKELSEKSDYFNLVKQTMQKVSIEKVKIVV